jgi:histidine kinase
VKNLLDALRSRLIVKIVAPVAAVLFACIFLWADYYVGEQERFARENLVMEVDRVGNTVQLGLNYAMMLNSRDDIKAIVRNYGRLPEIRRIRILNKQGQVMFSSNTGDAGETVDIGEPMCQTCHREIPPFLRPNLTERVYADTMVEDEHVLRLVSPIYNEESCYVGSSCHFHRADEKILGVLDIAFSLTDSEALIVGFKEKSVYLACILFVTTFLTLFVLIYVLIKFPIGRIIGQAKQLSTGKRSARQAVSSPDEIGQLSGAINQMGTDLIAKNDQLILQKNLYRDLFEGVPCLVTVQSRNYRLLRFNRAFAERFAAKVGDYCYKAYKNRDTRCDPCPVAETFKTGKSHTTEEIGRYKDGTKAHWIVTTAPVHDSGGNLVAAMEMCLDITERKELEGELKRSERKYIDIFNNIPSAVFVLDPSDFAVLDCNHSATHLYGYPKDELVGMSFAELFAGDFKEAYATAIRNGQVVNQAKHATREHREFYVGINSSPSEFSGKPVFLVTTSDITKRLETEQQLIQAGKMATLGEMATGVAHEINQPLAVIQTSIDLVKRSLARGETPEQGLLKRITELAGAQIDRAVKIIGHMREFGRKPEPRLEPVNLNDVLIRACEFFSQQLAQRGIDILWELDERPPSVSCEHNRMEQVFINFLVNARDAIEEKIAREDGEAEKRAITVKTAHNREFVTVKISDTGPGVPEAYLEKIFEPFFTTKQVGKGTGLGLSISYGIVKEYGGSIHVKNNRTGGASFYVRIPVAK